MGLTTASSAATCPESIRVAENRLGISPSLTRFGIPLGAVFHKPNMPQMMMTMCLYFAADSGLQIGPAWLVKALLLNVFLAAAAPPVSGGAASVISLLLTQLSLPLSSVPVFLAFDALVDFLDTGANVSLTLMQMLEEADRFGLVDTGVLLGGEASGEADG